MIVQIQKVNYMKSMFIAIKLTISNEFLARPRVARVYKFPTIHVGHYEASRVGHMPYFAQVKLKKR